ncbi:MAG: pyrroline-5-carboxylate reductase [Gammaproteobacteria bacterium]|nr:pyrroline-5-carboxylate reductase [Gammaproteobacteria bacterium]
MQHTKIGFIGGGNMAASLIGGLIADGTTPSQIRVADPVTERARSLQQQFAIQLAASNTALVAESDVVVLAVKPQVLREVCQQIAAAAADKHPLIISVAAGIRIGDIDRWLGDDNAIVRTMPNTPALVQCGATALYANGRVDGRQREIAERIMRAVGLTQWLENEPLMDAVTALSGSGPAYLFLVIEALEQAGCKLGLSAESSRVLALQTAFGAAKMALESSESSEELRRRVTSPGGTTERAIGVLEEGDLRGLFERALTAARDRAQELAEELGNA